MRISDWSSDVCSSDLFGKLRHWRPFAGQSAVPERGQGVAKDIFHCCVAFAFDAAGPALDQRDLNRRLPEQIGFWMHGFEIAADRGRFIYDRAVVQEQRGSEEGRGGKGVVRTC